MRIQFLLAASFIAFGCFAQVSTDPQPRNVLLEEFTAINCGNCPAGHVTASAILNANPGRVVLVNVHAGSLANPSASQPDFRTPWGNQLHSAYGVAFTPQGLVSRTAYNGTALLSSGNWNAAANTLLMQTSIVNLGIATDFDPATRLLQISVEHYYTSTSPGPADRIHVLLTEDHLTAYQANYGAGGPQPSYDHRHALRVGLTPFTGDALGTGAAGEQGVNTYSHVLPIGWDVNNMRVVAFISEAAGILPGMVHQAAEAPAIDATAGIAEMPHPAALNAFPNPANGAFVLQALHGSIGALTVRDASGRVLERFKPMAPANALLLDASTWPDGIHVIATDDGRATRLVVQH
ncbi:MAG: Omp28-related outer membrane protein [Flavobacteriales bacterium]|jgi:hypothetical protein|nr:Omp28-related outer membrane protein [Flavobacteriales bacterium]